MARMREGGCLCGAVRYRAAGVPARNSVCSRTFCHPWLLPPERK